MYRSVCVNEGNLFSRCFGKNFVKLTHLQNTVLWKTQCGKTRNSLSPKFFFREINYLKVATSLAQCGKVL